MGHEPHLIRLTRRSTRLLAATPLAAGELSRWAPMTELAKLSKRTSGAVLKEREQ